jgi:hypothetical protein
MALVVGLLLSSYLSVTIGPDPENSFWVERNGAVMPVWVRVGHEGLEPPDFLHVMPS